MQLQVNLIPIIGEHVSNLHIDPWTNMDIVQILIIILSTSRTRTY